MADLTPAAGGIAARSRWLLPASAVAAVVLLGVVRLATWGWAAAAPDDARYLYVGLSLLDGRGALTPDGLPYLVRSPVYPLLLALGARLVGGDPFFGAHLVAAALSLAGLACAVVLATRLGGPLAGTVAGLATGAMALAWELLPTLRIDLPQAAGVAGVLLLLSDPRVSPRWLAAGLLLGLTILVKESVILLALLPAAWLGTIPRLRLARLAAAFWAGAAIAAGWWWLAVWDRAGLVFPANGLALIEARRVGSDLELDPFGAGLVLIAGAAWAVVAARARRDAAVRPLALAGLLVAPPLLFALANGLSARNFAVPAVLSIVAIGLAGRAVAERLPRGRAPLAATLIVALSLVIAGQAQVAQPARARVADMLAAWLSERASPDSQIAATFRLREVTAVELAGRKVSVRTFDPVRVAPGADPSAYLWLGLRDAQLFGYPRAMAGDLLGDDRTRYLVVVEPHPLAPLELLPADDPTGAAALGLAPAAVLAAGNERATIYAVDAPAARTGAATAPLRASAAAAIALVGSDATAATLLVASRPIVSGAPTEIEALVALLGPAACPVPIADSGTLSRIRLQPAGSAGC